MMLTNWLQKFQTRFSCSAASTRRSHRLRSTTFDISSEVERFEDKCLLNGVLVSVEQPINSATDDAEEKESGTVSRYDTDLDIVQEGRRSQLVGLRFSNIQVPDDAIIRRAYIQFTADEASSDAASINIYGELSAESDSFGGNSNNISVRDRTTTNIEWTPGSWFFSGEQTGAQATPDLTPIIQELVSQSGWTSDSPMTFMMDGSGSRVARSFDAGSGAPVLHIDYIVDANYEEKEFLVTQSPRLQLGDTPLVGFGFDGSNVDQVQVMMQTERTGNIGTNDSFTIEYRKTGASSWTEVTSWNTTQAGQSGIDVHNAEFPNLEFNTEYEYRVRQHLDSGEIVEEWHNTFRTRLAKGDTSEFSFAAVGNSSGNPVSAPEALQATRQVMSQVGQTNAAFSLLVGNNLNPSSSYQDANGRFEQFINPETAAWTASHIEYAAYGSSDVNSPAASLYFSSPVPQEGVTSPFYNPLGEQAERNYSYDYGDTHFATFNSNVWNNEAQLDEVLDWLEKDMRASTAQWKIVFTNFPIASPGGFEQGPDDDYYQDVVERLHAAGVDLFLTGESSTYSWTKPLTGDADGTALFVDDGDQTYDKGAGLIQVTTGVGGMPLDGGSFSNQDYMAVGYSSSTARSAEYGFSLIEVREDELVVKYVAADDGEIIDSFTIVDNKYQLPAKVNIDGDFSDWADIPSYYDAADDVHDTDSTGRDGTPAYREHPDVDLLEYKVTHDNENLYFYFRAAGEIGETQVENQELGLRSGRYYVITTIDVDDDDDTGYWLDLGGYYPTTPGYDMNAEVEYFNGEFNTGHYINHGAIDDPSLLEAFREQTNGEYRVGYDGPYSPGYIDILPGSYDYYTQWVYDDKGTENEFDDEITFVVDRGPIIRGNVTSARSDDFHEIEMVAPLRGFLKDAQGNPIVKMGSVLDISFSLEASGELAPSQDWGSDTGDPINGYLLTETLLPQSGYAFGDTPIVDEDSGFHSVNNFMIMEGSPNNREFVISNNNDLLFSEQPNIDFETGELTFATAQDQWGVAVVSVTEMIDGVELETRSFNIYVHPTNDAPDAVDDNYEVYSNTFGNPFTPLDNDTTGPDVFESVSVVSVQHITDQGGTVELKNGQVTYTPRPTFSGIDTFKYTITDGTGETDTATISVNVIFQGAPNIVIDGDMSDWDSPYIDAYFDPADDQHDTDTEGRDGNPLYVDHPDADLLEYRVTNDSDNLYFYFRSRGQIGATTSTANGDRAGRFYVIVTIDVDNDDATGYWLDDGGYYPTTPGYDMNAEVEYYDGEFNTGHYLNHGAQSPAELYQAFLDQTQGDYVPGFDGPYKPGFVDILPGSYDYYSQWVYQENNPATEDDDEITLVLDKGPIVLGIIESAISADGHSLEMIAPLKGFMKDENGVPIIGIGSILDLSFSLEASGELSNEVTPSNPNGIWASDTADPLNGYVVQESRASFPYFENFNTNSADDFIPVTGNWTASNQKLTVSSQASSWYKTGISLLDTNGPLPNDFVLKTQFEIQPQAGQASNSFVIFDYESPTKYKFAGTWAGQNRLVVGQYENNQFRVFGEASENINNNTAYDMELWFEGSKLTMSVDGLTKITHDFGGPINDNPLGLGAFNSTVHFDNFALTTILDGTPKTAFPFSVDNGDDLEGTMYDINGNWNVQEDFAIGNSTGIANPRGITLFNTANTLPSSYDISTRMISTFQGPGTATNAYIVFDYVSPTNFKFAGMAVGQNRWVIGEYHQGWHYHSVVTEPIGVGQAFDVNLEIDGDTVTLSRNGSQVGQHTFSQPVNEGLAGLFVLNGESRFEDIKLGNVPAPSPQGALLAQMFSSDSTESNTVEQTAVNLTPTSSNFRYSADVTSINVSGEDRNGFLAFNVLSADQFSLAGVDLNSKKWIIGQYINGVYQELASLTDLGINPATPLQLEVKVVGSTVTLLANGNEKLSYTFDDSQSEGTVGVATHNARSQFTGLALTELSVTDSVFEDSFADLLI
ncbi:hypothetical protein Pla110_06530 [Polystyrenella longa]|uniref:Uncharacterized protein n=1 Tax=Polystyrenella longa TaxID=2528007 RepID=A0A518CI83_9PLAN|nr:Ig-like domain-containing protein [Polystyrenella longa]QDU78949.1 hypothetical protein Pla110_06530 [Polystyrenella longa]